MERALISPEAPRRAGRSRPSALRAWIYLVTLSLQRQSKVGQMVWIALSLLGLAVTVIFLNTLGDRWGMHHWRSPYGYGPTYDQWLETQRAIPRSSPASDIENAALAAIGAVLERSGFFVFSTWVVFSFFLSFLLPIWTLSFATDALGREREDRTLVWLLSHPLPRPMIYLAKFVALLPFSLGLNLGGFALMCLAAGNAGAPAFILYWPAILCGTLAFSALFHLIGACFRRGAVVAIVYSFFLETILGNMPGYMKRISIGFYTRCMMFDKVRHYGVQPEKPAVYLPVDGRTAMWILVGFTAGLVIIGMVIFSRSEYQDLT